MNTLMYYLLKFVSAYLRHPPVSLGRWRLHNWALNQLRRHGENLGKEVVYTKYGFRFCADLSDWLGQYVYLSGSYEPMTASVIEKLLKPGDSVLDVGANVGFFTLLAASKIGSTGHVYAFEPVPSVRSALEYNLSLNLFDNVTIYAKAVSDITGTVVINEGPEGHKGLSSMRPLESVTRQHNIESVAINDITAELGKICLIKIDVEGAELLALRGMVQLLNRDRPYLVIEFTDAFLKSFGHTDVMLRSFLEENGYTLWLIESTGLVVLNNDLTKLPLQFNVLCTPTPEQPFGNIVA